MPSPDFFARLDAFDWRSVEHAYGPATDVPKLIRQLTSADEEEREHAFHELYGNVWHQGTVYPASAPAARFIAELVADPTQADRDGIFRLLRCLATGRSFHEQHRFMRTWSVSGCERPKPAVPEDEWNARIEAERDWVRTTIESVASGNASYLRLLNDADPRLREGAAALLGCLPRSDEIRADVFWKLADQELDSLARVSLILAAARHDQATALRDRAVTALRRERDDQIRFALALALASTVEVDIPTEALGPLTEAAVEPKRFVALEQSPWFDSSPAAEIAVTDWLSGTPAGESLLRHWCSIVPKVPREQIGDLADILLLFTFQGGGPRLPFQELPEGQQRVLRALHAREDYWLPLLDGAVPTAARGLRTYGLPPHRSMLGRYIETGVLEPATAAVPVKRAGVLGAIARLFTR